MATENDNGAALSEHDRRSAPRYPAHFNVEAVFGFGAPVQLLATSVSQTGIFLKIDQPPEVGDRVTVRIDLPYATVRLAATVRRVVSSPGSEPGFAVQVDRFDEGEEAWASLVRTARMRAPK
jgi:hypothetical protein